ncbi:PQQ-dependent sugar dehydrogenase [Chondrinema litorale]|uniref:PQQ-dependent sugar dehydrogenase n=1 Tax=Chondrinema litorale TaxID=2994555 RepID=UPI002542D7FF|nr:PQQ-dependent sugar dehydrogenase [Chondrinema litorale]UZR98617.1 PQQ-dependent sugar dehydrogenase [Chondrinema litorale]
MKSTKLVFITTICILLNVFSINAYVLANHSSFIPDDFTDQLVVSGLGTATDMVALPNGKILVTEKAGDIYLVDPSNVTKSTFMTVPNVESGSERGVLSITLDPNFEANGYFYVYHTTTEYHVRISRFTSSGDTANPDSEYVLWESTYIYNPESQLYHFGGAMDISDEGIMYFAVGDMFQENKTQDNTLEQGKLYRIYTDGSIPADNPFYNNGAETGPNGELPEIYAWGLRNPFRGYYDEESDIFIIGEVGGNDHYHAWEDIHYGRKGANYGWPDCGESGRDENGACENATFDDPVYTYAHKPGRGNSITGGFIYRNGTYPSEYQGVYFFSDYAQSWIQYLELDDDMMPVGEPIVFRPATGKKGVVSLIQGLDGSIYYLDIADFTNGLLKKITYTGTAVPVITEASADVTTGGTPLEVNFTGAAIIGDNTPLTYSWDFGDGNTSTDQNPTHTYTNKGSFSARLTVTSIGGEKSFSDEITITVGDPPVVTITSPTDGSTFVAGDIINFSGSATDDGDLDASNYSWEIVFLHDDHTHPGVSAYKDISGTYTISSDGSHSYHDDTGYIFTLTVTDEDGISTSESVTIRPEKANISFQTEPSGLKLTVANQPRTTPYTLDELIGFQTEITAVSPQDLDGKKYAFKSWSNGKSRTHIYTNPTTNSTLTAYFELVESSFLEAEEYYEIVTDEGSSDIGLAYSTFNSQEKSVGLFDTGDRIKIAIDIETANAILTPGNFIINAQVRSGNSVKNNSYWPNGYNFYLDDEEITFTGVDSTIAGPSSDLGGSYWGTMTSSEVFLNQGIHYLEIEANAGYGALDYIELVKISADIPTTPVLSQSKITDRTVTFNWTSASDMDGIDYYEIYQDGEVVATTEKTKYTVGNLTANTDYDFYIIAYDNTGAASESSNTLEVTTNDTMDAGIIITSPDAGEEIEGPDAEIKYVLFGDETSYDHIFFQIDDDPTKYAHDLDNSSFIFTNLTPGTHTVTASVALGHNLPLTTDESVKSITFEIVYSQDENDKPGVVITSPQNQENVFDTSFAIDYTLYGNQSAIAGMQITLDEETPEVLTDLSGSYTFNEVSTGEHEVKIELIGVGDTLLTNAQAYTSVSFVVYNSEDKPSIKITYPSDNEKIYSSNFTVTYEFSGSTAIYDHAHLQLDDQDYVTLYNMTGSYDLEEVPTGQHQLILYLVNDHQAPLQYTEALDTVTFVFLDENLPTAGNFTKKAEEDNSIQLSLADFEDSYYDVDTTESLIEIKITSLPDTGKLMLNTVEVEDGAEILTGELDNLIFVPDTNWYGETSFEYYVSNGLKSSAHAGIVTFSFTAVNDAPYNLTISKDTITENNEIGVEVAHIDVEDVDNDSHQFTLIDDESSTYFEIDDHKLIAKVKFNYELKSIYEIEIQADDKNGGVISTVFTINILDQADEPLGIEELIAEGINIYPNPVSDKMSINIDNDKTGEYHFEVSDVTGKMVKKISLDKTNNILEESLDVSSLQTGMYILKIRYKTNLYSYKFMKR